MQGRNALIVATSLFLRELVVPMLQRSKFIVGDGDESVTPDLVVGIGINAGDMDTATEQIRAVRAKFPDVKSAVVTNQLASADVLKALIAGVDAILSMDASVVSIQSSLELVMMGHRIFPALPTHLLAFRADTEPVAPDPFSREISDMRPVALEQATGELVSLGERLAEAPGQIVQIAPPQLVEAGPAADPIDPLILSDREEQILRCLVAGLPNKLIARELGIAETTVKVHVKSVLRKVRAANRTQAAMWAVMRRGGLLNDPTRGR